MKTSVVACAIVISLASPRSVALAEEGPSLVDPLAVVVFNSFGPGNTFTTSTGWGIAGSATTPAYRGQAQFFTPAISGTLSLAELAIGRNSGSAAGLCNFFIAADNRGIPGSVLESFLNRPITATFGGNYAPTALESVTHPVLQAGQTYWLCAEPASTTSLCAWNYNNQGLANGFAFERSPWGWSPVAGGPPGGVFRISLVPVPEPSTLALLGAGLLALGWRSARRKPGA
jgi:hypothetical protein